MKNIARFGWLGFTSCLGCFLFLALDASSYAALVYNGNGSAQIEFSAQPFTGVSQVAPTWTFDGFTGANDILTSPGATFNQTAFVNANIPGSPGIVPLGGGYFRVGTPGLAPGGLTFYGGSVGVNASACQFSIQDNSVSGDNSSSIATAAWSSQYVNVGAFNGQMGTYLSLSGVLAPDGSAWASLVTTFTDLSAPLVPNQNPITLYEILAVSGTAYGNKFAVWSGVNNPTANVNGWVQYGGGGSTFTALASASFLANIFNGDLVQQTSVLTLMADPASSLSSAELPSDLNGVTLPELNLMMSQIPEPGTWALVLMGFIAILLGRRLGTRLVAAEARTVRSPRRA